MIWCIEDEKAIRDLEIYTLNSVGIAAKGFEDAATAYKALEAEKPELILLDIMLPGMNGEEFLKKLNLPEYLSNKALLDYLNTCDENLIKDIN